MDREDRKRQEEVKVRGDGNRLWERGKGWNDGTGRDKRR